MVAKERKKQLKQVLKNQKSLHLLNQTKSNFYDQLKKSSQFFIPNQRISFTCISLDENCYKQPERVHKELKMNDCEFFHHQVFCSAADYCYQLTHLDYGCIEKGDQLIISYFKQHTRNIERKLREMESCVYGKFVIEDVRLSFDYIVVPMYLIKEIVELLNDYFSTNDLNSDYQLKNQIREFLFNEHIYVGKQSLSLFDVSCSVDTQ